MSYKFVIALSFALVAGINADIPVWSEHEYFEEFIPSTLLYTKSSDEIYRLPENVKPLEYDIYIDMYFGERQDKPFSYDGITNIIIQATENNIDQIVLHANLQVQAVSLKQGQETVPLNISNPFYTEPQYHFLKVNLEQPMEVGVNYTLVITYTNNMNEGPLKRGIWKGQYTDAEGKERIYAATHFQPYNARQAFPCWDEPLFKAVFRIHLSRPQSYQGVFSNTGIMAHSILGNGRVTDHFQPTPKMSSYLVTFLVSETFQAIAQDTSYKPPVRIIGRSNTVGLGSFALERTVKMTEYFGQYFDMPYSTLDANLYNDHVSSPDWASAGTENWGMVSYRELYMIVDSRETLMSVEHYATTLIAHELAHKWFGNLITCFWWSNTWINEGFASYFGYIAANKNFPQYELHEHFVARYVQNSLSYDSGIGSEPLNFNVNTPAQVTGHFGTISYSKGAAFLQMTISIITEPTFRKACQYFLKNNSYMPTNQHDLYEAFAKAIEEDKSISAYTDFDFSEYYRIWVNEPGYPLLNVTVNHETGEIILTQERFLLSATTAPQYRVYPIPITYSTKDNPDFKNVTPVFILNSDQDKISKEPKEEWVIFNNMQHNLYRVNYDDKTWILIAEALLNDPQSIHHLNRAQIVDDVYAFMRSGKITYDRGFVIFKFLRYETNYHVWDAAITMFNWFRNRFASIPNKQAEFDAFVLSYLETVIKSVNYEPEGLEMPTQTMTREIILHFACTLRHEKCVEESKKRFLEMKNGKWIPAGIRRNVYVVGIREGGQAEFDFLMDRLLKSNYANDQLEMLRALGASKDPARLTRYLELTLTKTVRHHDKVNSFSYALLGNKENAYTALQFVKNNIDAIRREYIEDAPPNPVHSVLSNLASYLDEEGLVEYEEWLRSTQTGTLQYNTALAAITTARNNMVWAQDNVDNILAAAKSGVAHFVISSILISVLALIVMI